MRPFLCLAVMTLSLAVLPMRASADTAQPAVQQSGFDGSIDLKPGSIDGRVMLESGSVDLQAMLADTGPQGQLRVLVPGYLVGSANVGDGALSYQLEVCGAGVTLDLNGTRNADLRFAFRDAAADPARCTALPSATPGMTMGIFAPAAAQTTPSSDGSSQAWLIDWLRRLVGFALVGTLLVLFIPAMPRILGAATQTSPWSRVGIGLVLAFMLPLLGLLGFALLLPLGLWWLGLLILALYPVLLILSLSVSGLAVGSLLLARLGPRRVPMLAAFAAGLIIISLASVLPYLGPLVNVAAVIFGLGTLALAPRTLTAHTLKPANDERASPSDQTPPVITSTPVPQRSAT
jgi:hypothetical protein